MKAPRRWLKVEKSNFAKFKGSIFAQHGSQEGSQERSKIESKSIENQFSLELAVGKSPGPQKVLKNGSKMHPNRYHKLPAIFMVSHRTDIKGSLSNLRLEGLRDLKKCSEMVAR